MAVCGSCVIGMPAFPARVGRLLAILGPAALLGWITPPAPAAAAPPAAPKYFTLAAVSTSQIDLAWTDASSNETNFDIHNGVEIRTVPANAQGYAWTGLSPGQWMCFMI